jgi:hypothetical protein
MQMMIFVKNYAGEVGVPPLPSIHATKASGFIGRCLAPDYVGIGNSGAAPHSGYRFRDHQRYLDAWFEKLEITSNVILVVHDWGSALGFSWAHRHPEKVKAFFFMEAIVRPFESWLSTSPVPKLFIDADPGGFLIGALRDFCRSRPNQTTVTVNGSHFLQEESPEAVGLASAAKMLAGQIGGIDEH